MARQGATFRQILGTYNPNATLAESSPRASTDSKTQQHTVVKLPSARLKQIR
jgi:hypothetical protein